MCFITNEDSDSPVYIINNNEGEVTINNNTFLNVVGVPSLSDVITILNGNAIVTNNTFLNSTADRIINLAGSGPNPSFIDNNKVCY